MGVKRPRGITVGDYVIVDALKLRDGMISIEPWKFSLGLTANRGVPAIAWRAVMVPPGVLTLDQCLTSSNFGASRKSPSRSLAQILRLSFW